MGRRSYFDDLIGENPRVLSLNSTRTEHSDLR